MRHFILEDNMKRLESKLTRIENKCNKYNVPFTYHKVGEVFREKEVTEDGVAHTLNLKFIEIEVEGKAQINDWEFIAAVEHTEKGNLLKKCSTSEVEIPTRYYTSDSVCEHCNSKRTRNSTYIVRNTVTNEFKQVGRSCLADFTHGLDAEAAASYVALFDELIKGEAVESGGSYKAYANTKQYLSYAFECVRCFGYSRTSDSRPTAMRAREYYELQTGRMGSYYLGTKYLDSLKAEMDLAGFDASSEYATENTQKALDWISAQKESNDYMHNLKVACSLEFISTENYGIVASLVPAFNRELEHEAERRAQEALSNLRPSSHVGSIGDRISFTCLEVRCLTSWETQYGMTYVYKFIDETGNVYTWKTGKSLEGAEGVTGTVKSHNEYRGVLQTELTRCKIV